MVQTRKRLSYILPPPSESTPLLQLPPLGVSHLGAIGPLLTTSTKRGQKGVCGGPQHPRHRLGVASLALDTSTQLVGQYTPEGILYSGGRDGLIMSWELGIQLKRRRQKDSANRNRRRARWEVLTGWGDDAVDEETDDDERLTSDGDILGEVTNGISKRKREASLGADLPYERRWEMDPSTFEAGTPARFRQSVQAHGDWVNDILLCNRNQTVISASSDGTLKAWNPHAIVLEDPSTIGSHSDYVRCLAHCREQNWVASGAFDRTIKIWDLNSNTKSPLATLNLPDTSAPKASIYALAVDPFGHVITSGSPERVIRLWDPRSSKRVGKLVGHTDNIRAMLISADSKYLLTGSADASIKLWSLASQRCLHTFAHHTDSVWSLFSDHPSLEVFYSGDRSGLVCRVDVEDCSDISEGECVLLCNDADSGKPTSEGINKIVVMDDNLLWTASGTSTLRRWNIPPRRISRPGMYLLDSEGDRFSPFNHAHPSKGRSFPISDAAEANLRFNAELIHPGTLSEAPSLYSLGSERLRDREVDSKWNHLPYDSLVRLVSANDPFPHFGTRTRDPEVATLYSAASVLSIPRLNLAKSPAALVHSPPPSHLVHCSRTEDTIFASSTARAKYEEREFAADAMPICPEPDFIIPGDAGLVRCIVLNDRIHALAVDTLGGVAVWDVIRGMCLGRYSPEDVASAGLSGSTTGGSGEGERSPRESLDLVRERIEGEAVISPWCMADTKAGVLTIHLMDKCFEAEVYADEVGFATDRQFNEDSKLNLGKWVLRNLFMNFISEEVRRYRIRRAEGFPPSLSRASSHEIIASPETPTFPSTSTTLICSPTMKRAIIPTAPAVVRSSPLITPLIPLHPQVISVMPAIPQSPAPGHSRTRSTGTTDGSLPVDTKDDYFSARLRQNAAPGSPEDLSAAPGSRTEPPTPITASGLMGRLRNFGRTKRPVSDTPSTVPTPATETLASEETKHIEVPKTPIQNLLSGALNPASSSDAPTMSKPPNATILISEEGSPSYTVVYRSLVSSCHDNIEALEKAIPLWLAEYLLLNQSPPMPPPVKLSFVLVPWNKDQDVEPLPELLNTQQSKLTANRNLRIRKILCHVQDRLERMSTSSRAASIRSSVDGLPSRNLHNPSRPQAEEIYELLCNDVVLPLGMTLAAVRQYVWKSSAELVMLYRRKRKVS